MLNTYSLVGKLLEVNENENSLILAVQRTYKNENNIYDYDFIKIYSKVCIANLNDYLKIGDLIASRGRIETDEKNNLVLESEKIFFIKRSE